MSETPTSIMDAGPQDTAQTEMARLFDVVTQLQRDLAAAHQERDNFHMDYRMKCDADTKRLENELAAALAENAQWCKWGVVEIAIRNPSVMEYMKHWEERAERAKAERDAAVKDAERLNWVEMLTDENAAKEIVIHWRVTGKRYPSGIRAAIDAAIAEGRPK